MKNLREEAIRQAAEHNVLHPQDDLTPAEVYRALVRNEDRYPDDGPRISSPLFDREEI